MNRKNSLTQPIPYWVLICAIYFLFSGRSFAQDFEFRRIAAGADSGEIYISCYWYDTCAGAPYGGLFRSTDHGQTLSVQYKDLWIGGILYCNMYGDLLPGSLYVNDGCGVSHDYGLSWEFHDNPFIFGLQGGGGSVSGEIYLLGYDIAYSHMLYHGTHFGDSLYLINTQMDSLYCIEAGSLPGELFAIHYPYYGATNHDTLGLAFSNDYGQSFSLNLLDTIIVKHLYQYTLTHGPDTGELYLIGRKMSVNQYHILHSMDYGHTFSLQYITPVFYPGWDEFSFVAGREPGSFYILQYYYCATLPLHTCLEIHYSSDYGVTYTTYYHELDSTFTGISTIPALPKPVSCYPNPASDLLTVRVSEPHAGALTIGLRDITGRMQLVAPVIHGQTEIPVDVSFLKPGIYILEVKSEDRVIGQEKIVIAK